MQWPGLPIRGEETIRALKYVSLPGDGFLNKLAAHPLIGRRSSNLLFYLVLYSLIRVFSTSNGIVANVNTFPSVA